MVWDAVLLAAGESRRLGRPKQLLEWRGVPLVRRAAEAAIEAGARRIVVVVGAVADRVREALAGLDVEIVDNPQWHAGIGSSIAAGVAACTRDAPVVMLLSDQPDVDATLLGELVGAAAEGAHTVACRYGGSLGVPALFSRQADLEALQSLAGDRGAKALLQQAGVVAIENDAPVHDIDVEADWVRWTAER